MTPKDLTTLADRLATDIIFGLQVDRTGVGKYVISGYPDDYRIHVSRHASASLAKQELSRVAALTKAEVEDYLNGILRVGDQLVRTAQDPATIITLIERFGPNANSVDELWGNIEGAMDTDTLSEEFRTLIEQSFNTISQGNLPEFYRVIQQLYPDDPNIRIPAMPDTEYGMEAEYSISTPSMPFSTPGMPMPSKGLAAASRGLFLSKSSMPVRLIKHAQEEEDPGFDYLDYYTRDVEPGSPEEVDLLVNVDPLQIAVPAEEIPTELSERLEVEPFVETEQERAFPEQLQEEEIERERVEEEKEKEKERPKEKGAPKLPGYETEMTRYPDQPPDWWSGYRSIMGNLPPGTIDMIEQRLDENVAYREDAGQALYTQDYKDRLGDLGELFDISGIEDPKQRDKARGRMRQQAFDEVWSPYALIHAFTVAGMSGMARPKQYLRSWMAAHFPSEFVEQFDAISEQTGGANMEEGNEELLQQVYWWRDPKMGEGHGTDPTAWDREFLEQIPETLQIDTELKLGDDPRRAADIGTITIDNPIYTTYIYRPKQVKLPITREPGELRPDDPRSVAVEFPEEAETAPGKPWASERQRAWWHSVGPGSRR